MDSSLSSVQKRNRSTLSCIHCRQAKSKCDRVQPCGHCVRKGRAEQCTYPLPASRKKAAAGLQKRLKTLENMVKDVLANNETSSTLSPLTYSSLESSADISNLPSISDASNTSESSLSQAPTSQIIPDGKGSKYIGSTHWKAILDNIEEARDLFEEVDVDLEDETQDRIQNTLSSSFLAVEITPFTTQAELLAGLPSRNIVDRIVTRYFNTYGPSQHTVHIPSFQKEYQEFWNHPESTTYGWLALLFAMMTTSSLSILAAGLPNPDARAQSRDIIQFYRRSSQQCLILSEFAKPELSTIRTLTLNMEADFVWNKGDPVQYYLAAGTTMRLALHAGLHRDATQTQSTITTFEAEMRRRIWCHLLQIELLASLQAALPALGFTIDTDTLPPHNLLDSDFGPDSVALPVSRPSSEATPSSHSHWKGTVFRVIGKINILHHRLQLPSYSVIHELDKEMVETYNNIPSPFRLQNHMALSVTDKPEMMIKRLSLSLMYHRGRFMLHRKYLNLPRTTEGFQESKQVSIEISVEILRIQALLHEAFLPGGPLCHDRWLLSALSLQEFLTAGMVIYQALNETEATQTSPVSHISRIGLIELLKSSHHIWTQTDNMSAEMRKAAKLIGMLLIKLGYTNPISSDHLGSKSTLFDPRPNVFGPVEPHLLTPDAPINPNTQNFTNQQPLDLNVWDLDLSSLGDMDNVENWDMFAPDNSQSLNQLDDWDSMGMSSTV